MNLLYLVLPELFSSIEESDSDILPAAQAGNLIPFYWNLDARLEPVLGK